MAIGKKALRVRRTKGRKGRGAALEANAPGKAMEALDHAMGMSRSQAEAAFRAAVRKVEEIIQVGKRELDVVRSSARDALDRLVAAAQRARHSAEGEAVVVKRAVKRATTKATRAVKAGAKPAGRKASKKRKS